MSKMFKLLVLIIMFYWSSSLYSQVITPSGFYYEVPWYPNQGNLHSVPVYVNVPSGSSSMFIDFYPPYGLQILNVTATGSIFSSPSFSGNRLTVSVYSGYSGTATLYLDITTNQAGNLGVIDAWSHIGCCSSGGGFGVAARGPVTGGFYSIKTFPSPANEYLDFSTDVPNQNAALSSLNQVQKNFVEQEHFNVRIVNTRLGTEIDSFEVTNLQSLPRIETSKYEAGMYSLIIEKNGKKVSSSKFVVKH